MGPTTLIEGDPGEEEIELAASLTARYSDCEGDRPVLFRISDGTSARELSVVPIHSDDPRIAGWRIC